MSADPRGYDEAKFARRPGIPSPAAPVVGAATEQEPLAARLMALEAALNRIVYDVLPEECPYPTSPRSRCGRCAACIALDALATPPGAATDGAEVRTVDPLPCIRFEYGGRDAWHIGCPVGHHAKPYKHLPGRLPIGDGVVLYEYECTACAARLFAGIDKQGWLQRRASGAPAREEA